MIESARKVKESIILALTRRKPRALAKLCARSILLYAAAVIILLSANIARAETVLVAFGDSLTAGLGVKPSQSFASQLEAALRVKGHKIKVVNSGVSGDTTAAGLARLDWAVPENADAVIVELGANDALRGLPPARAKANLDAILTKLKKKGLAVLLTGMIAPRNYGPDYAREFDPLYDELAAKHGVPLYPFFLEVVAGKRSLNQPDGLHPNPKGVAAIVSDILPSVEAMLKSVPAKAK